MTKLEGRISRARDTHESLINSMRDDQLKFQSEIRSAMTTLPVSQGKASVVVNHVEEGELGVWRR